MSTRDALTSQGAYLSEQEDDEVADESPRGSWEGSSVSSDDIGWLRASRRIPEGVACRRPGDEISPEPEVGEYVVFVAHFERGFGLPVSEFVSKFMERFGLQPHHLPANAIFHLSCLIAFSEAYLGLWPTIDIWAKFYGFRTQVLPDKDHPDRAK